MNKSVPWSVKGVDFDARTAAKEAARKAGMTLGEWLNSVIAEQAAEQGVDPDEIGEEDRVAAVRSKLEKLDPANARRRGDRSPGPRPRPAEAQYDEEMYPERAFRPAPPEGWYPRAAEAPYFNPARSAGYPHPRETPFFSQRRGRDFDDGYTPPRGFNPEDLLDDAARAFEKTARRASAETHAAIGHVQRRLETIEERLEPRRERGDADSDLKRAIARLENRMEALAAREEPAPPAPVAPPAPAVPQALRQAPAAQSAVPDNAAAIERQPAATDLSRIEDKLNRLLEREAQPSQPEPNRQSLFPPPSRRPMQDAIAEINRRQGELDRSRAGSVFAPPRTMRQATAFAAAMAPELPAAPPAPSPEIRNAVAALKGEISGLARQMEAMRLESERAALRESAYNLQREAAAAPNASVALQSPDIEDLRRQIAEMSAAVSRLAPREGLTSLEQAVRELGEQVAHSRMSGGRDGIFEPVENLIADLNRNMANFAPREAIGGIERELHSINRNIASLEQSGIDRESFARACAQTAEIRELLAAAAARPAPLEKIEQQVAGLTRRIDLIAARGPTQAGVNAVNDTVGEIRASMESAAPGMLLVALEERIESLARKIDQAAERAAPADARLDSISRQLDSMQQALAAQPSARDMQVDLAPANARLDSIAQRLDSVQRAIMAQPSARDSAAPGADFTATQAQLDTIAQRLDAVQKALASPPGRDPLASLDAGLGQPQLDVIAQRLDSVQQTLAWQAERAPVAKVDTGLLETMLQQIMERVSSPSTMSGQAMPDLDQFEKALRDLAGRVDALARQPDFEGTSGIEERLAALASKFGGEGGRGLDGIHHTLGDLASQIEETRLAAIDAAADAARTAARDVLAEFARHGTAEGGDATMLGAKSLIEQEIGSLRALQDASDRRTHATLGAVHETLEKVVDRLAMIESDIPAKQHAGSQARGAGRDDDGYASGPAPVFSKPEAGRQPERTPTPDAASEQSANEPMDWEARRQRGGAAPEQPAAPQRPVPPPEPIAGGEDILIEPGMGVNPARQAGSPAQRSRPASPSLNEFERQDAAATPAQPGRAAASNFIAAARRAQQAAQAQAEFEAAQAPPPKRGIKSLSPENALAEARARAKSAASAISGSLKRSPAETGELAGEEPAGRWTRAARALASRKVLFSLAGIVLVLGALTIVRQNMMRQPPARPVAAVQPSVAPPVQSAQHRAAQVLSPALVVPNGGSISRLDSNAAGALVQNQNGQSGAGARTDPAPVASIPAAGLATAANNAPNQLRSAANAGDARAQYELAVRMIEGRSEPRDPAGAVPLMEKAAQSGLAPAQYRLGALYEKGIGVSKDVAQARHWYEQAATAGNIRAMHNLAVLLAEGGDGKADYSTASTWFKKAAEFGVRDSQYNLAILYARGLGIEQSLIDSFVWFSLAEAQGDADAATKRADVGRRLSPGQMSEAKTRVERFRAQRAPVAANDVPAPAGGWRADGAPASNIPSMALPPAALPAPAQQRRPRVSSL